MLGARLFHYAPAWSCQDKTVLKWIWEGYQIPFITPPPITRRVRPFCLPAGETQRLLLLHKIQMLLEKNVLARVPVSQLGHASFHTSMFLVPKPNRTYQPILNVSSLNVYIDCPHFNMETVQSVRASVRPADWTFSIDLKDAYLHVLIHPGSYRYLRLAVSPTEVYHFLALPFGLNTAPLVFTRIVESIASHIRQSHCLHVHVYLDNWLFRHQDREILL